MSDILTDTDTDTDTDGDGDARTDIEPRADTVAPSAEELEAARIGGFAEQLVGMLGSATTLLTIELGRRFGLYRALRDYGPMTASALARTTGAAPRYAREWLEQQAAAGIIEARDAEPNDEARRFSLPAHHVPAVSYTHLTLPTN